MFNSPKKIRKQNAKLPNLSTWVEKFLVSGTNHGSWPWMAAIGAYRDGHFHPFCGGSLITQMFVLTAAHCITLNDNPNWNPITARIRIGDNDLSSSHDDGRRGRTVVAKIQEAFINS